MVRTSLAALTLPLLLLACAASGAATTGCLANADDAVEASDVLDDTEGATIAKVKLDHAWALVGDGLTEPTKSVHATIEVPSKYKYLRVAIDQRKAKTITRAADGTFQIDLSMDGLETGEHKVLVASKTSKKALGSTKLHVSAPLYVVASADWDDTRFDDSPLGRLETLRKNHPGLKVTQFFAPFHYTDPQLTPGRKQMIEAWVKKQRDTFGDELGVHVHGWCHYIQTTGVPCKTKPSFYVDDGTGYTTILKAARKTFADHGLGAPTSFRAGGWTAGPNVMRAVAATGFTVESSAVPAANHLASWKGYGLYTWTTQHWHGITETSQPYWPLADDPATADPKKALGVLEVPDNGVLVDYMTGAEMKKVFDQNLPDGAPLDESAVFQVGWHPPNFSYEYQARLDEAFDHVDEHLFANDLGPAVYVNMSDLLRVWKR